MKLLEETALNFKGIRSFTFETGGRVLSIQGNEAAGRALLYEAFPGALLDRDSSGQRDFELETLDKEGRVIQMPCPGMERVPEIGGAVETLNETLPESDSYITGLCSEPLLRMLTDPDYFPDRNCKKGGAVWEDRGK